MFGFQVTKDQRVGNVVSQVDFSPEIVSVVVVWEDHSFSVEAVQDITAVPNLPEQVDNHEDVETAVAQVLSLVPGMEDDESPD